MLSKSFTAAHDVVVVGGGLVGTALACALGSPRLAPELQHCKISLVDSQDKPQPLLPADPSSNVAFTNRVSSLTPASVKLFQDIGVWDFIEMQRHRKFHRMRVWDSLGGEQITFSAQEAGQDFIGCIVENNAILAALQQKMRGLDNVKHIPQALLSMAPEAQETDAKSKLADNPWLALGLGNGETHLARLVVGADGANSKVRELSDLESIGWDYDQQGVVATLSISVNEAGEGNATAWQRYLPTGPVALLPLSDNKSSLVWSTTKDLAKALTTLPEDKFLTALNIALTSPMLMLEDYLFQEVPGFRSSWGNASYPRWTSLSSASKTSSSNAPPPTIVGVDEKSRASFPLRFRHCPSYMADRVALVGDAAHSIHPHAGLGLNMGYSDVRTLTKLLNQAASTGQDLGSHIILSEYSRIRVMENLPLMSSIDLLKRIFEAQSEGMVLARTFGLQAFNLLGPTKGLIMKYAMSNGGL